MMEFIADILHPVAWVKHRNSELWNAAGAFDLSSPAEK